jgi:signal transduction histidine kinase
MYMKDLIKKIWCKIQVFIEKYPVIIAAVVIYLYYLLASVNLFRRSDVNRTFLDYVMEFDSLFFLWLAAAALLQVQKIRKAYKKEEEGRRNIERVLDRQQIYSALVNDITMLLQDNVNNPLAVISVTTQEIRRRFETDAEIVRFLDRIDGAMKRIHNTIRDIQSYEAQKLVESTTEILKEKKA